MKSFIMLMFIVFTYGQSAIGQTSCGIHYYYDDSGNRKQRIVPICDDGGGGGGTEMARQNPALTDSTNAQNLTEALYPNPTSGLVNIVFNNTVTSAQLTITDNLGRQVLATTISGTTIPLNITRLPQGMYYVTINTNGVSFRNTVVRE